MRPKRAPLILTIISIVLLPVILSHKSATPIFCIWSAEYMLFVILYAGFLALCLFCYFKLSRLGVRFCVYILFIYISAFLLSDFIIGSVRYYSQTSFLYHPVYHHILRPGKYRLPAPDKISANNTINLSVASIGLRSCRDISEIKEENSFRILVLGDSFVEGVGVNDDETFCCLLEDDLNGSLGEGVKYEVINGGVGSYAPILEYLYLKTDGIKLNPDFVVLFFDMSDLWQTPEYLKTAVRDKDGNVLRVPPGHNLANRLAAFIRFRFYFISHLIGRAEDLFAGEQHREESRIWAVNGGFLEFTLHADQSRWENEWQRICSDIMSVNNFCKERDIGFAVAIYPWGHQVDGFEWPEGRRACGIPLGYTAPADLSYMLEERLTVGGVRVINLFPVFRSYKGKDMLYYRQDMHWTKYGHRIVAEHLFSFIREAIGNNR